MANRTIFVGDLSCFVTEQHLMQLFSPCGPISSVEIKRSASGDSLMHGFVKFLQEDAAILATRCFHDKKFMGRRMVVNPTTSRAPKKPYDQWHKLTLHFTSRRSDNLDITEEVLDVLCSGFGEIGDTVVRNHAPADAMAVVQQSGRKAFGPITGKEIIGYAVVFFLDAISAQRAFEALHHQTIDQITFQCSISAHTAVSVLSHQLNPQPLPYVAHSSNKNAHMNMNMDVYNNNYMNTNANMYLKEESMSSNNNLGVPSSSFYHPNNANMANSRTNTAGYALPAPPQNTSPRQLQPPYASAMIDNSVTHFTGNNAGPMNNHAPPANNNAFHPLLMASTSSSSSTLSVPHTNLPNNNHNTTNMTGTHPPQMSSYPNSWVSTNTTPNSHAANLFVGPNNHTNTLNNVHNTSSLSLHSLMSPTSSFYVSPSLTSQPSFFSTSSTNTLNTNVNTNTMNTTTALKTVSTSAGGQQEDDMYFANLVHFHSNKTH